MTTTIIRESDRPLGYTGLAVSEETKVWRLSAALGPGTRETGMGVWLRVYECGVPIAVRAVFRGESIDHAVEMIEGDVDPAIRGAVREGYDAGVQGRDIPGLSIYETELGYEVGRKVRDAGS